MDFRIDWIEPNVLAASGIPIDLREVSVLQQHGIRAIVSLTEHPIVGRSDITTPALQALDIVYLHEPIPDGFAPDLEQANKIVNFIDQMAQQNRPVFIHCFAGIGRTGTLLHAYYLAHGYDLAQAMALIRSHRPGCAFVMLSDSQRAFLIHFAAVQRRVKPVK